MKMLILAKNLWSGTYLWSQTPDTEWYRANNEVPDNYYRLVLTWRGGWSNALSRWLFSGWTLTSIGTPTFFIMENKGDRLPNCLEKWLIIIMGVVLHLLDPLTTLRKILYPKRVQNRLIE